MFIFVPPLRGSYDLCSFDQGIRDKRLEHRTRTILEGVKAIGAFVSSQRIAVLIEHRDSVARDQEVPFASDAVVKPSFPGKERAVELRPDHELVPSAAIAPFGIDAGFPYLHGTSLRHIPDHSKRPQN
jgi:hypothetical protein